jgi:hypothetical protein
MNIIAEIIQAERLDKNNLQKTFTATLNTLPNGVFVKLPEHENAYLWYNQHLYLWSFTGYKKISNHNKDVMVDVLTPASYVAVFKMGYKPQIHSSVEG